MNNIIIEYASEKYAESYGKAVDKVARERKYIASTEGFPLESTKELVKMIVKNNLAQYYAIENGEVIGWCDVLPKSFEGLNHVATLGMGLLPSYRRKGIGSKLLNKAIAHANINNNIEKVELEVFEKNTGAIQLYQKFNFNIEGKREKSRKLDNEYDNIILMGRFV